MKKVCIFSALFLPSTGGVERFTDNLSKGLEKKKVKVTIVTSNYAGLSEYEQLSEYIEIYRFPCINFMKGRFPFSRFLNSSFKKLNKKLFQNNFDLTVVNTRFYLHSIHGAILGHKCSKKVVCLEHGSAHLTLYQPILDFIGRRYEHLITKIIKIFIKDFYGVSNQANIWLKHFNIKSKGIINNAINITNINRILKTSKPFDRKKYNIPLNVKLTVFTGRLVREKGVLNLIEAFRIIYNEHKEKNIHLVIAGEGPLLKYLQSVAPVNVHVPGKFNFDELIPLLEDSDIFCLPSRSEGFSTSALEAAACHNFIIATPVGGVKELVEGFNGILLSEHPTIKEIAYAILYASDNENIMKHTSEIVYKRTKELFCWEHVVERVLKLIE